MKTKELVEKACDSVKIWAINKLDIISFWELQNYILLIQYFVSTKINRGS